MECFVSYWWALNARGYDWLYGILSSISYVCLILFCASKKINRIRWKQFQNNLNRALCFGQLEHINLVFDCKLSSEAIMAYIKYI